MKHLLVLTLALFTPHFSYAESVHGVFMVVKGTVKVLSNGKTSAAKVGGKVFPQDTILTEKDSRAKLVMSDKNEINVAPESKLELEKYVFNPQKDEKSVLLNVVYGKVRSSVSQKYDGEKNTYRVKTPSAVAGVRGTDFLASFDAGSGVSKIVTFSGVVEVGTPGTGGTIANPVRVTPGQFTTTAPNTPPAPPAALPKAELQQLNQESRPETGKAPEAKAPPPPASPTEAKKESQTAENRAPASAPAGLMIDHKDLGPSALTGVSTPDFSNHGGNLPIVSVPVVRPTDGLPTKCDFCERQIQTGSTKVNIQVNVK